MNLKASQFALNPIQWNHTPEAWKHRSDPAYRVARQPSIYRELADVGFDAVMLEVVEGQDLDDYAALIAELDLRVAPGIVPVAFPEDLGVDLKAGTAEFSRWFDPVRRLADASHRFDLQSAFLCPHMPADGVRCSSKAAVGWQFDQDRLDRIVEVMAEAATVLKSEGIRAGLHNHIGTWIETEYEITYVLDNIDASILSAGFDIGHLEWAGIDSGAMLRKYRDRLSDVHIKDLDLAIAQRTRRNPGPYLDVYDENFFLEPGRGGLDMDLILDQLGPDYDDWMIIEVDRTSLAPRESAEVSLDWVRTNYAESGRA